jgi:hypothetical protein
MTKFGLRAQIATDFGLKPRRVDFEDELEPHVPLIVAQTVAVRGSAISEPSRHKCVAKAFRARINVVFVRRDYSQRGDRQCARFAN